MRSEASYTHQRQAGFTCRVRLFKSEDAAKRSLWAIRQNGRLGDRFEVRYCNLCSGWHIVRAK